MKTIKDIAGSILVAIVGIAWAMLMMAGVVVALLLVYGILNWLVTN